MLRRNGPVVKSVESVLRLEGSLWWERFVKELGLEVGVKERGSYGWWEWWVGRVRRCGRSMSLWPCGVVLRALDSRLKGSRFSKKYGTALPLRSPFHYHMSTSQSAVMFCGWGVKLFTHMCLCHQAVCISVGLALHWPCITDLSGLGPFMESAAY